uniref:Uncharacterized protein n=1 Tax=Zea mays TaxID=4577 RepID=A0A804P1S1_MAIZE
MAPHPSLISSAVHVSFIPIMFISKPHSCGRPTARSIRWHATLAAAPRVLIAAPLLQVRPAPPLVPPMGHGTLAQPSPMASNLASTQCPPTRAWTLLAQVFLPITRSTQSVAALPLHPDVATASICPAVRGCWTPPTVARRRRASSP